MPIFISKDEAGDPRNRLPLSQLVSPLVRGGQVRDGVYSGIRLLAMALACASLTALTEFSNPVEAAGRGKNLSARGSVPIRFLCGFSTASAPQLCIELRKNASAAMPNTQSVR